MYQVEEKTFQKVPKQTLIQSGVRLCPFSDARYGHNHCLQLGKIHFKQPSVKPTKTQVKSPPPHASPQTANAFGDDGTKRNFCKLLKAGQPTIRSVQPLHSGLNPALPGRARWILSLHHHLAAVHQPVPWYLLIFCPEKQQLAEAYVCFWLPCCQASEKKAWKSWHFEPKGS